MAEITLSILARQCLSTRMASTEEVRERVMAWQKEHNQAHVNINWRFTTSDARKLSLKSEP